MTDYQSKSGSSDEHDRPFVVGQIAVGQFGLNRVVYGYTPASTGRGPILLNAG
jgi:hypothetical protein